MAIFESKVNGITFDVPDGMTERLLKNSAKTEFVREYTTGNGKSNRNKNRAQVENADPSSDKPGSENEIVLG